MEEMGSDVSRPHWIFPLVRLFIHKYDEVMWTWTKVLILVMLKPVVNNNMSARTPANPRNRKYPASRFLLICPKGRNKTRGKK